MWKLLVFYFKTFRKVENLVVAIFYFRNKLALLWNFLGLLFIITKCTCKMSPQICIFSLGVMVIVKMLFFVTMTTITQGNKNTYLSTQKQNIKLINSPSCKSNIFLILEIKKLQRVFYSMIKGIGHSNKSKNFWKWSKF